MNLRLLLVEDEGDVAAETARWLREHGYDVDLAADLPSARRLAAVSSYAAVVLDIRLGETSGLDLLDDAALARKTVLLSGTPDLTEAIEGLLRGAHDFVEKSADPDQLLLAVGDSIAAESDLVPSEPSLLTATTAPIDLDGATLRARLLDGEIRVQAELEHGGARHVVFEEVPVDARDPLLPLERRIVVGLMAGEPLKSITIELGTSQGSGWAALRRALRRLAVRDRAQLSRVWTLLR